MLKQVIKEMRGHLNPHSMVPKNVLKDWLERLEPKPVFDAFDNEIKAGDVLDVQKAGKHLI